MKIVYYLFVLADKIVAKVPVGIIRALAHAGAGLLSLIHI